MPELPEVETIRRGLLHLTGRELGRVDVRNAALRYPLAADFARRIEGRTLCAVERRSKYLLFDLGQDTLLTHLGMSGQLVLANAEQALRKHDHVLLGCGPGMQLRYHDPRRFGWMEVFLSAERATHPRLCRLGPEPLSDDFDGQALFVASRKRACTIKALLLDAHVVAGLGNIYVCESLFRAGIRPQTLAGRVSRVRCVRLVDSIRECLTDALADGGTTLRDYRTASGASGYFAVRLAVYDRAGKPCSQCGQAILRTVQGGRGTFHCPRCQG